MRTLECIFDEEENVWVQPTGHHVEAAAKQLLDALRGSYIDVNGQPRPVKGDVTKLQYVPWAETHGAETVEKYASHSTWLAGHTRGKETHAFRDFKPCVFDTVSLSLSLSHLMKDISCCSFEWRGCANQIPSVRRPLRKTFPLEH